MGKLQPLSCALLHASDSPGPGIINLTATPFTPEEWKRATFRERLQGWCDKIVRDNGILPMTTVVFVYSLIGLLWWSVFRYYVMNANPAAGFFQCGAGCQPFFSDLNMRRFVVYNVLHGVLGFGATSSLLGFRFKVALGSCAIHFLTPGSLCSPLLPAVARLFAKVPGRRGVVAVACYAAYVVALVSALRAPELGVSQLYPIYGTLAAATVFDFSIFQASRGEHYGYMMICLAWPDWKQGMQVVQIAIWMWAAFAKVGPWFGPVMPFLMKDSLHCALMPKGFMNRLFVRDYPRDLNWNGTATFVAALGTMGELGFPLCCVIGNASANMVGSIGMVLYHCLIIDTLPFASVFEWNYYCIVMSVYLFFPGFNSFALPTSPGLIAFLCIVSFLLPLVGQLCPTIVPFLVAYRPYMGNWRFSWYVCHKSALPKHKKLKTVEDPFTETNGMWFYSWLGKLGEQSYNTMKEWPWMLSASILQVPGYRPFISIMEKLLEDNGWSQDDIMFSFSEPYQNQVFGWSLGTGWIAARECTREAYNAVCGFGPKEMYFIQFEPASPLPWGVWDVQYRCFDVTKGPREAQYHGKVKYAELSASQPADFHLKPEQMQSGNSIRGTFLSTYY